MPITTLSGDEFEQDPDEARTAADQGPVFITDRGRPAHVLLSIKDYRRLAGGQREIAGDLEMRVAEDIEFDPPKVVIRCRPADLD